MSASSETRSNSSPVRFFYVAAEEYHPSVYAKRNRYMVERSDRVIAVYDGREKGGTVGTIRLAHTMKKELREIAVGDLSIPTFLR